ncbi:MAG: type II secretion system F family protein [Hyphomonas sp.]
MPAFEYVAVDAAGIRQKGTVSADSQRLARRELRLRDLWAVELKEVKAGAKRSFGLQRGIPAAQRAQVIRQLAALLQSGLPVEQALTAAASQSSRQVQASLLAVLSVVREGARLSIALREAPQLFSPLTQSVIAAGERAGKLGDVMEELASQLERSHQIDQKVRAALIYPAFLAIMSLGMIVALLTIIVPRLVDQFDAYDAQLPMLTRIVVAVSNAMIKGWPIALLALAGIVFFSVQLGKSKRLRASVERIQLRTPLIGSFSRTIAAARFARVFSILSGSGATVLEALEGAARASGSEVLGQASAEIATQVRSGGSFAAAMQRTGDFPAMMAHMVLSGEAGRNIPAMMDKAANYLEADFDTRSAALMSLLEPAIILVLGGIVGTVVLAIMLPILQVNTFAFQ